ncbi:TPA: hypothetical protein DEP34_01665 [Candidatus Uhrbacteria bacterium]|uniref:Uncharacterized protein n=2 Tax=Candidatus Uhriibacteriota TaxID=1752732 RepID=A0A0G1Q5E1_9BACT|nr:MAG: hypothetical protein UX45_C0031G0007 [Candidatus Uhrbacteria bacterium GW2011_GWF2_46_218]KKU40271.1 MAG: hypothetical protein UX57_C0021G0003 [Candidatus Uhrbacteria bacterium GW2011_GWE2_46_68]HBK34318.1 hypothetical protein [Candidatus Uhrbacteria bacterium]HCB19076.1 hypothetical protein [Candidatus Uhrbacteria bacterium]
MTPWSFRRPPFLEESYPRETRLMLIPRLLELGFTKEDTRSALKLSHIQVVKDDLCILRDQHTIGPELKPTDLHTRLRRVIALCARLEGLDGMDGFLRSVLIDWMQQFVHEEDNKASFLFPTMLGSKGERDIIPITKVLRFRRRPA